MDFKSRLKKMQTKAKDAMADYRPGGYAPLPDNDYEMRIVATLDETNKLPKRLQVTWCFTALEGDHEGQQGWDRTIIEDNKVGLQICRARVEQLGYEWPEDDLAQLQEIVEAITEAAPSATVRLRSKDAADGEHVNTNYRILEVHEQAADGGTTSEELTEEAAEPEAAEEVVEEAAEEAPEIDETLQQVLDFCAAQGIDGITSEMSFEEIVGGLRDGGITFKKEELSEEEVTLLESIEAADLVIAPAKKVLAKKTVVAVKPAAKPALKKAGKK